VPNGTLFYENGFDDEEVIKKIWIEDRNSR